MIPETRSQFDRATLDRVLDLIILHGRTKGLSEQYIFLPSDKMEDVREMIELMGCGQPPPNDLKVGVRFALIYGAFKLYFVDYETL